MAAGGRTTTAAAVAAEGGQAVSKASCCRIAGMNIEKTALTEVVVVVHWRIRTVAVAVDLHRKETQIRYDIADGGEGAPENWTAKIVEFEREGLVAEVHLEGSWTKKRNQG